MAGRRADIYRKLKGLRGRYATLIRERYPRIPRRVSGYNLDELLPERGFHVARALIGSEGTCVTIREVVGNLVAQPAGPLSSCSGTPIPRRRSHTAGGWRDKHIHETLDLCLSCKGCKGDCPVAVDVATYKAEFLSHYNAGAFGYEEAHYEVSIKCGERVLLPTVRNSPEDTLIIADGFSCREQIEQETDRRALHTAQVLQMALHDGARGPATERPESRYPAVLPTPAVPITIKAASGALLLGGAYMLAQRIRKARNNGRSASAERILNAYNS